MTTEQPTRHRALTKWVNKMIALCEPNEVHWCDGSQDEWNQLSDELVEKGTLIRLNPEKRPNSFLARSAPSDVARVEERTFISTKRKDQAGPTNNWCEDAAMKKTILENRCGATQREAVRN